jgi:hypothetical protein
MVILYMCCQHVQTGHVPRTSVKVTHEKFNSYHWSVLSQGTALSNFCVLQEWTLLLDSILSSGILCAAGWVHLHLAQ